MEQDITQIGRYEVQSEIGRGAFGKVFRAYDPVTRRSVAIKVLITDNDPDVLARFFLEVQATAKLKHKNIVTIYDFNENPPYIVMELLEGESLQQVITHQASLSLLEKVRILSQAAEGLACAHKNGIVHRDIKPANIMVLSGGDVKIMDFGIALVSGETEARRTHQGDWIGTPLYMSPERIQRGEAAPYSDIFSLGAVGYELITGKHPFEGTDLRAVAYKIMETDPPSIQQLVPECPDALDLVLQRALAKEPESRYQSMEDVLFDLMAASLDLSQQQATPLMREVQRLIDLEQYDEALDTVRRVLELDPSNRGARRVHDSIQKDLRLRQVRARVDALIQKGEPLLAQRQFNQAVQFFEAALRLEPSNLHTEALLKQAKAALEANRQASRLLAKARETLASNLDAACEYATEAFKADPGHYEAEVLCEKLKKQITDRDKRLRAEKGVRYAEELLARQDINGARAALADVEREAEPEAIRDLRSRIESEETEQLRRTRELHVQRGVVRAGQQMQAGKLAEAGETLRALLDEFPDATAASRLLTTIREHIEAQGRAEAIGKCTQEALGFLEAKNFVDARRVLEDGIQTYKSDPGLQRLLDRTVASQRAYERAQAVTQILEQAKTLQAAGRTEDALALIGRAPAEYRDDPAVADLKGQLEFELEQKQYDGGLRDALAKGQSLVDSGKFNEAVRALEESSGLYPTEAALTLLLALARQAQTEQEEQQSVTQVLARISELVSRQQLPDALEYADEALKRYPYNAELSELTGRTREKWRQEQRQSGIARRRATIEQALASGNLNRAANELQTALQNFPGEKGFEELEEKLRQAQLESLENQVHQSLARGDLDRAAQQLEAAQGYAHQPGWQALHRELEQRQEYQQSLQRARRLNELKEYQAAEELLDQLIRDNPPSREAAALLDTIRAERRRAESERLYREALEEADGFRKGGDYDRATEILHGTLAHAPDRRAEELLETIGEERWHSEQKLRLERGKNEVQALIDQGVFQKALTAIDSLQKDFRDDGELKQLRVNAEQQRELSEGMARIKDLEQRRQFESALGVAETVLQANTQNADLAKAVERLREAAIGQLGEMVHSCFAKNDLERGAAVLDATKQRWGCDPRWLALEEELGRRQAQASALGEAEAARKQIEQRTAKIKSLEEDARALLKAKDFDAALARVELALQSFPDEPNLLNLRQTIIAARTDHQQSKFIQQVLAESAELERAGHLEQAGTSLEKALQRCPGEVSLTDALTRNRQKQVRQQEQGRTAALQRDLKQANSLIEQGQLVQARQLLRQMRDAYIGEGEIAALLDRIQIEEQRRVSRDALCAEIQLYLDTGEPDKACESAARGLAEFGPDPQLTALAAVAERGRARKAAFERAQTACRERNWRLASGILETLLQQVEHDSQARRLLDEVLEREQSDLRQRRRDDGRNVAEKLIRSGRLEDAVRCLRELHDQFPNDAAVRDDLSRALEAVDHKLQREAYAQGRRRASASLKSGQFATAIKVLEGLLRQFPDDAILREDLKDAREAHSEQGRRERYATERRRASGLVQVRKLDDAVALLQVLLQEYPNDALLEEDLKSAIAAQELQHQREALDREVAQLEKLYRKGDARAVQERASRLSPEHQDARLRELLDWAGAEIARSEQEREREPADSLQRKRKRRITIVGAAAIVVVAVIATTVALHNKLDRRKDDQPITSSKEKTMPKVTRDPSDSQKDTKASLAGQRESLSSGPESIIVPLAPGAVPGPRPIAIRGNVPRGVIPRLSPVRKDTKTASNQGNSTKAPDQVHDLAVVPPPPDPVKKEDLGVAGQSHPPPQIPDCDKTLSRPTTGTLTWRRNKGLEPGGKLDLGRFRVQDGSTSGDSLPDCKIEIRATEGITVGPQRLEDGYSSVTVQNVSPQRMSAIDLRWTMK